MKAKFISETIKFERGKDPRAAMGIGKKAKILDKLKAQDVKPEYVEFGPNSIPYPSTKMTYWEGDRVKAAIKAAGIETMDPEERELVLELRKGNTEDAVQDAWDAGVPGEIIEFILDNYTEEGKGSSHGKIFLKKLQRTEEERQADDDENIYIFIGYTDKVPIEINGKKYYEDKFMVENMIKVDKYNPADLNQVTGMKLRVRYQEHKYDDYGVYMLKVPKELMDEDNYYEIPDHLQEIVEKYKVKL